MKIIPGPDGGERSRLTPPVSVGICVPVERGKKMGKITAQYITGTVGSVSSAIKNRKLDVRNLKVVVLDEADKMMEDSGGGGSGGARGGKGGKKKIKASFFTFMQSLQKKSPNLQWLCYSATYTEEMKKRVLAFCGPNTQTRC